MADKKGETQSYLIIELKKQVAELGRVPSRAEFESYVKGGRYKLGNVFGTYENLLKAAGLPSYEDRLKDPGLEQKLLKKYRSLCLTKTQIQGFFRHTLDLQRMFELAGNPDVLKMSAMPDTHVKYRDVPAVNSYLKFLEWYQPHVHMIKGDFADCEGLSHWPDSSLAPRRIVPEMKEARALLTEIVKATPNCSSRIFLEGNHEDWINQALSRMPELFDGLEDLGIEVSLKSLMRLEHFGYELFPVNHLVQIGKAHFTHGIFAGNGHAKKHLDTFKASIYYGHTHDALNNQQTSMDGPIEAAAGGCLCRLDAKFLKGKPNNWVHGHTAFEFFRDGTYIRYFIPIKNGLSAFAGKLFDGNI